jgi:hypothetical protein
MNLKKKNVGMLKTHVILLIIILNKQQKQAYLLDIAVPNSHNITQTYNTKINKYRVYQNDRTNFL